MRYGRATITAVLLLLALVGPATAAATPSLVVSPAAGPPGTVFMVTGGGFPPHSTVRMIVLYLAPNAGGGRGEQDVLNRQVPVAADGSFALAVDSATFVPETYHVVSPDAPSAVVADFVVTNGAGTLPGLPNTGGGGAQRRAIPAPDSPVIGGVLAVLGGLLLGDGRRRRQLR